MASQLRHAAVDVLERPYPLARNFYLRLMPLAVLAIMAIVVVVGLAVKRATEAAYLSQATHVAANIAADVAKKVPLVWSHLISGEELNERELAELVTAFGVEQAEYRLSALKVYDLSGRTLYSSDTADIGDVEANATLLAVIKSGQAGAVRHVEPDGTEMFELYVPYGVSGRPLAVFELYESHDGGLQRSIVDSIWPVVAVLSILLAGSLLLLVPVVRSAQNAISQRTAAIVEMRQRLERLLSPQAVNAMRTVGSGDPARNVRVELTLFYSDVRSFTTFCEQAEPEEAVRILNQLVSAQVEEIEAHGGDVDKIIGDGILARFDGDQRHYNAVQAAKAVQTRLELAGMPLGVGVGVYSGPVVAGLLGSEGRLDYTIIGDSVNVAARLCATARSGEVVVDTTTLDAAKIDDFGAPAEIEVKGRLGSIAVRRWMVNLRVPA